MRRAIAMAALLAAGAAVACRAATPAANGTEPVVGPVYTNGGTTATLDHVQPVTVREVLERPELVGSTVRVTGRCLALGVARASGPPPRTRSDWQLASGDLAVWVTGARPADCTTSEGSTHDDTITARVAQDTVRVMPSDAGRVRRYLVGSR